MTEQITGTPVQQSAKGAHPRSYTVLVYDQIQRTIYERVLEKSIVKETSEFNCGINNKKVSSKTNVISNTILYTILIPLPNKFIDERNKIIECYERIITDIPGRWRGKEYIMNIAEKDLLIMRLKGYAVTADISANCFIKHEALQKHKQEELDSEMYNGNINSGDIQSGIENKISFTIKK